MISDKRDNLSELMPDLIALGFSEYEARAYLALYELSQATAYEVAKRAGLPKANAYTVLESLAKKEAAQPISENPLRYVAVSPKVLFERIASTTSKRCAKLIRTIPAATNSNDGGYVWSIKGEDAIAEKMEEMIDGARSHIWVKTEEKLLLPHREALQRAAKRGVSILIILFGTQIEKFQFGNKSRTYLHEGNGIPVGLAPHLVTLTVDFEQAMVAEVRAAGGSYTRNKPIVNLADSLLRHEIYFAEIFEMFGQPIQKTFGPAIIELRRKYLPEPQVLALEKLLGLATKPERRSRLREEKI